MLMLILAAVVGAIVAVLAVLFAAITIAIRAEDRRARGIHAPAMGRRAALARRVAGLHVTHTTPYHRRPETAGSPGARGQRR